MPPLVARFTLRATQLDLAKCHRREVYQPHVRKSDGLQSTSSILDCVMMDMCLCELAQLHNEWLA